MKIEFVTNSSFLITLAGGKTILSDPWFTDGAFYGSWHNFPPVTDEQRSRILGSRPDFIYISHIHADHLDPTTLKQFANSTPILIGKFPHDHLRRALTELGFSNIREFAFGDLTPLVDGAAIAILAQFRSSGDGYVDDVGYAIDTSIVVRDADGTLLLNVVDNPISTADATAVVATFGRPDVAIVPFAGASFYPHSGRAFSHDDKTAKADAVRQRRLNNFIEVSGNIGATWTIPAAGAYVMGGRIAAYSEYLHQATPSEIAAAWSNAKRSADALCVMMTADVLDTSTKHVTLATEAPFRKFTAADRATYALTLHSRELPHDKVVIPPEFRIPWARLLPKARRNLWSMQTRLGATPAVDVELHIGASAGLPTTAPMVFAFALDAEWPYPTVKRDPARATVAFYVDASLLLMALIGTANWNNIEVAALVDFERIPEKHDPTVHSLMSFFTL